MIVVRFCVIMNDWVFLRRVNLVFFLFFEVNEFDEFDGNDDVNGCYFIFCKYKLFFLLWKKSV